MILIFEHFFNINLVNRNIKIIDTLSLPKYSIICDTISDEKQKNSK